MAKTQQDRLDAVRAKLKKTDFSSGGGSGFWSPPVGKSVIRILPEVGNMQYFFQSVGKHNLTPDGKKHVYCPDFTSDGELQCPICDMVDELRRAGDAASKKLAGQLGRKRMFWMNVIVRGKGEDAPDQGPFVFTPGVQVFGDLASIIEDPDYGEVFDVNKGFDIRIEREGTGLDTEYTVRPRPQSTKLSNDPDQAKTWLSKARDLSYVELSEDPEEDKDLTAGHAVWVLPYERIVHEYDLDTLGDEDEEEEEIVSKKSNKVAPAATKKSPRLVVEEEEDDDEEVEDDDDVEETHPAKQEVSRRMARRSNRR